MGPIHRGALKDHPASLKTDWEKDALVDDLPEHFPEYSHRRAELKAEVLAHQSKTQTFISNTMASVSGLENASDREQVAMSLVHRCMRRGEGMRLEITADRYSYSNSSGGVSSGPGKPGQNLVDLERAFSSFQSTSDFSARCDELSAAATRISAAFEDLAKQARALSESAVLRGDCQFVEVQ
jgi:hypothetical protein